MPSFLYSPCLASVGEYVPFFPFLIPITVFFAMLVIIVTSLYFKNQQRRMWHETARLALEKGQPVPIGPVNLDESPLNPQPAPVGTASPVPPKNTVQRDIRAGLILLAISAGLYFGSRGSHDIPGFAVYIPGFIGIALLLNALITFLFSRKESAGPSSPQPPKV